MATKTPTPPAPPVDVPESLTPPTAPAPLPTGFRRLADVRPRRQAADAYASLKPFVGKSIQLDDVSIAQDLKSGSMRFSEFVGERTEGTEYPQFTSPIPLGALKSIIAAMRTLGDSDDAIVCDVVQTKRGVALR